MSPQAVRWYWHALAVILLLVALSAVAIWFDLGPVVHSSRT
jgi:hypothetical protein